LKNRFGHGYAIQVKVPINKLKKFKDELMISLPGIEIEGNNDFLSPTINIYIEKIRTTQRNALL
jgi:hypothetical protein